jgi:hypothetical protein
MSDLLTGTRTLDEVPDEDDGDDDNESDAERRLQTIVFIGVFFLSVFTVEAVLFPDVIQPLAVNVDPGLAGDPQYEGDATYPVPTNGPARLKDLSHFVSFLLTATGYVYITENLDIDGQTDD